MCETPSRPAPGAPANPGRVYLILLAIYFGLVVYGSLVPLEFRYVPFEQAVEKFREIPYLHLGIQSRSDLVANFLLFIPLTFLAMGAFTRENRRRAKPLIAAVLVAASAALSAAIEFTQIYFIPRTVSQNDIFAETIGGLTGIVLWFCFGGRITRWTRSLWNERAADRLAVKMLGAYVVGMILCQMLPFDLIVSQAELSGKLESSKVEIIPFNDSVGVVALAVKIAIMIPIGFLLAVLHRPRRRYWIFRAVVQTCLLAVLIEAAQLFVYSRYSSSSDVVLGTVGGLLGVVAAMLFGPTARYPIIETALWRRYGVCVKLPATIAWTGVLAWEKWRPFDFVRPAGGLDEGAREILVVPFARYYFLSEFQASGQIVREFATFFILGMLLRGLLAEAGRAGRIVSALLVVVLAVAFEFGQVFLPSRTADLTAMLITATGGVVGVCLFDRFVNVFLKTNQADINKAHSGEQ